MADGRSKIALITGASSGMGKEIAKSLLNDKLIVVVAARSVDKMADLKELDAHPLHMDITDEASIQAAVDEINNTHCGVDVLVNNAGFGCYGTVEETDLDDARYQLCSVLPD